MLVPSRLALVVVLAACQARRAPDADPSGDSTRSPSPPAPGPRSVPRPDSLVPPADSEVTNALAVLRDFYAAVSGHDYSRAYAAWGPDGPPGRPTLEAFAAGYALTDSARLTLGTPGPLEGAAGSRYLAVPVTVRAFERGGRETIYVGSYTLRRSVVSGADAAARRWHLYRSTLHPQRAGR